MQIKFTSKGSTLVVRLSGELDHHSAEYVRDKMDSEILKSTTKNMILDFSKVTFMDSSGIGVVMGRYKNIKKLNGEAGLIHVSTQVQRILEMSGILKFIPIYDSIDNAMSRM